MISAILLAAGQSKRMNGENKLIKKFQGVPLISHSVKNILDTSIINELIVVVGHQKEIIKESIDDNNRKIKFVFNKDFKSGIASSIKTGIINLSAKTEFFFICLGDMPLIKSNVYNQLIKCKDAKKIIAPFYKGQQGNPVLFSISLKNEIMSIKGDIGSKEIIKINNDKLLKVEMDEKSITKDLNTLASFDF